MSSVNTLITILIPSNNHLIPAVHIAGRKPTLPLWWMKAHGKEQKPLQETYSLACKTFHQGLPDKPFIFIARQLKHIRKAIINARLPLLPHILSESGVSQLP